MDNINFLNPADIENIEILKDASSLAVFGVRGANGAIIVTTKKAKDGKIDPVIGREKEIDKAIEILCQRRKNNPLLVGEPGVGKTAIAEGLARKIVLGEVPSIISQFQIYFLNFRVHLQN